MKGQRSARQSKRAPRKDLSRDEPGLKASELRERIKEIINSEPVVLFMKGSLERVACGNSACALEALRTVGAGAITIDVLSDLRIRQELSALSDWPTIPQLFVQSELIGGADIVEEMLSSGELERTLEPVLAGE